MDSLPVGSSRRLALAVGLAVLLASPAASAATNPPPTRPAPPTAGSAQVVGSTQAVVPVTTPRARWRAPLEGQLTILRPFAPPTERWAAGHRGVDLAAPTGALVTSAGDGVVTYAGMLAGRGVVSVTHGELRTTYEPVIAQVHTGDLVSVGQALGQLAGSGGHCGDAPCLHWGLLRGADYLNPVSLLRPNPSRLLPLGTVRSR